MQTSSWLIAIAHGNPVDRAEVRRLLVSGSDRRYEFVEYESGNALLQACDADPKPDFSAVILDYFLPDVSAVELLEMAQSRDVHCAVPVVVLTGTAGREAVAEVITAGAQDCVGESWLNSESLTRAVENAVVRHELALESHARAERLAHSEERLRLAFEAAHMGWWDWDVIGDQITWSDDLQAIMGFAPPAFSGTFNGLLQFVHPDDRERFQREIGNTLEQGTDYSHEVRFLRPDGTVRWALGFGKVVRDEQGRPVRLAGVALDITARKLAEAAAMTADRRKDDFLAMLAHELRSPVGAIACAAHILQRSPTADALARTGKLLQRQVEYMRRMLEDLLDMSRISQGRIELRREELDLNAVVADAVEAMRSRFEEREQHFRQMLSTTPLRVKGDSTRLAQVVFNLLNNAAKFTHVGGEITIETLREGSDGLIRVRDNGIGIPPDVLPTIFALYQQEPRALEASSGGLGIGLSLVRRLVELHEGSAQAKSAGLQRGSEFEVRLPLLEEDVPTSTAWRTMSHGSLVSPMIASP